MKENPTGKNLPVYASLSTMRQEPSQSEMNNGVIPLDTLPAAWWNWMWNAITQAQNDSMYNDDVLFTEINNVLTSAGITPGTSAQHDQLRQAIMVIKDTIATTAAAGSVLSTDDGTTGTVKVSADGKMTVNNFGDIASFHGATKDNLVGALNEAYDIAYGNKDNAGELTTLSTDAKDTLVAAINELDAGKAPTAHASTSTTYGVGNAGNYGHVKLTDTLSSDDASSGIAATPKLVQDVVGGGMGAVNAVRYTYVVDSNQKLADWANNVTTGGQDYTSVLIRKGEWTSTIGVNLTNAGTKVVVGEADSKLVFNEVEKGIYYDTVPESDDYSITMVTIDIAVTTSGNNSNGFYNCANVSNCVATATAIPEGNGRGYAFYNCNGVTNCTGTGCSAGFILCGSLSNCTGTSTGEDGGHSYGFVVCKNLSNCTGTGNGKGYSYGFDNCENLTSCTGNGTGVVEGYGFARCTGLSNCTGTGASDGTSDGKGYGFYSCKNLSNCTGTGNGKGYGTDKGYGFGYGFHICSNLSNCTGTGTGTGTSTGTGYGFHSCSNLSNCTGTGTGISTGTGTGFHRCSNLSNCTGTGTGDGKGYGYGFQNCHPVIGCRAGGKCTTSVFFSCYASSAATSTYACADTANGGFNNTTNPSA